MAGTTRARSNCVLQNVSPLVVELLRCGCGKPPTAMGSSGSGCCVAGAVRRREGSAHDVYFETRGLSKTELWVATINPPAVTEFDVKGMGVLRSFEVPACGDVRP